MNIVPMQVFSLHLFFATDFDTVEHSESWHVEQALQSVVLTFLDGVNAEVHLRQEWQILDVLELIDLLDSVEAEVEELERVDALET